MIGHPHLAAPVSNLPLGKVFGLTLALLLAPLADGADLVAAPGAGDVLGCDHFAFLRPSMPDGLGGPALESLKSWDGENTGAFDGAGYYYQVDVNNSVVFRVRGGQARLCAGNGVRGHRDGPADQARFDFGVGSYSDTGIAGDARGNVYVSEAQAGRLRKIFRQPDGTWWVATVAGGGTKMPAKGESLPALQMKIGTASRFALTPEGTVYFATYGGIYQIKEGQGTVLVEAKDLKTALGDKTALADWHVGGSFITSEGQFYWMPGGGPYLLRCNTRTGLAEPFAGLGRTVAGLDGPDRLQSGFHTVLAVYSPEANRIYTCGGDESVPRRIYRNEVTSLHRDGRFRPYVKTGRDERWRNMAAVQCLDPQGRLYILTGDYGWGGWIVRFTFQE